MTQYNGRKTRREWQQLMYEFFYTFQLNNNYHNHTVSFSIALILLCTSDARLALKRNLSTNSCMWFSFIICASCCLCCTRSACSKRHIIKYMRILFSSCKPLDVSQQMYHSFLKEIQGFHLRQYKNIDGMHTFYMRIYPNLSPKHSPL